MDRQIESTTPTVCVGVLAAVACELFCVSAFLQSGQDDGEP